MAAGKLAPPTGALLREISQLKSVADVDAAIKRGKGWRSILVVPAIVVFFVGFLIWKFFSGLGLDGLARNDTVLALGGLFIQNPVLAVIITLIVLALLAAAIAFVVVLLRDGNRPILLRQLRKDIYASEILAKLRRNEPAPRYVLYLRPCMITDDVRPINYVKLLEGIAGGVVLSMLRAPDPYVGIGDAFTELETSIASTLPNALPLIGLGKRMEHEGCGRIELPDSEWQEAITLLARHAEFIVLTPSMHKGTLFEVELVLNTHLAARCVFISLPDTSISRGKYDQTAEWRSLQTEFDTRGYVLPADVPGGSLLFYGEAKSPALVAPLAKLNPAVLSDFFARVLTQIHANHANHLGA